MQQANARRDVQGGSFTAWYCLIGVSVDFDVPDSTETLVPFDEFVIDDRQMWDASDPTKINITRDGFYVMCVNYSIGNDGVVPAATEMRAHIRLNGNDVGIIESSVADTDIAGSRVQVTPVGLLQLVEGDYLQVYVWQNSGLTLVDTAGSHNNLFSVQLVG